MASTELTTGGDRVRTVAFVLQVRAGCWSPMHDAGGPLDAPDFMPAGAMDSTSTRCGPWSWNGGTGRACPAMIEARREA